ncbi:MAG: fibronectin type III domain-containing protein [Deltaproteobacteria bacterium]|nr:fibronectin type III domain-containing protein [Deltaproteobacteria bacterium]
MRRLLFIVLAISALMATGYAGLAQAATLPAYNPEVPPGSETPQGDLTRPQSVITPAPDVGGEVSGIRRRRTATDVSSGDEDEFEDLEIERLTVEGVSTPGLDAGGSLPSAGGVPGLPGTLMKPKETGGASGGEPQPGQKKTPKFRAGKDLKDSVNLEGTPTRLRSCGTFWTGWIEDPDSDINPCQEGCVRGEATLTTTHKSGDKTLYQIRYQCYFEDQASSSLPSGVKKNLKAGELAPGSMPKGALTPESGPWHTVVRVTGEKLSGAIGVRVLWYPNDDDTQELAGSMSATLRKRIGHDGIEIEMPRDAGGAKGGVVRVMVNLQGASEPVFAGRFTVVDSTARKDLRKKAGADLTALDSAPTQATPQLDPSVRPTGGLGGLTAGVAPPTTATPQLDSSQLPTGGPGGMTTGGGTGVAAPLPMAGGRAADAAGREVSTKSIEGPAPAISEVRPQPPASVMVAWTKVAGADRYVVHAMERGASQPIAGQELPGSGEGSAMLYALGGLTPGFDYAVWVQARYPDGKTGASEHRSITMPAPINPAGFTAEVTGPDSVSLSWEPSEGAAYYWVEGRNLPRQKTTGTAIAVSGLPEGTHEWTLMAAYGASEVYNDLAPSKASASFVSRDTIVGRAFDTGQLRYPNYGPDPAQWKRLAAATDMDFDQLVSSFDAIWVVSHAFRHILGRDANNNEATNYITQVKNGRSWQDIWRELAHSAERDQRFGYWAPAPLPNIAEARAVFGQPTMKNAETCFGGLGDRCDTEMVAEPVWHNAFTMPDGTLMSYVAVNVAVGSILHDNACLKDSNGLHCDGQLWHWAVDLNPNLALAKAATPAAIEWNKAVWNVVDGRKWREIFGPYPVDKDLRRSMWYDDLRPAQSREAWMGPVFAVFTIPVHTERYNGAETRRSRALGADPGMFIDYRDAQFCRSQAFSKTESKFGAASWGTCR